MTDLLFATPWWLLVTLAVIGVAVAWSGLKRQEARSRNAGLAVLGVAAVLFAVSYLFETDKEKVERLNRELVQSVPAQDWSRFAALMDADATLGTVSMTLFPNRAAIVKGAQDDVAKWGLKSVSITHTEVKQDAGGITVDIAVLSKQDVTEGFIPATTSNWQMVWDRTGADWHCHQIICLGIGQEKSATVGRYIRP